MITIVSPHIDDAVLSMGGTIARLQTKYTICVTNVFSISNWINPALGHCQVHKSSDTSTVTAVRKIEDETAGRMLGYRPRFLDFKDVPLRDIRYDKVMYNHICDRLINDEALCNSKLLFFPLGLVHLDHLLIHEVGIFLGNNGFPVLFYEDLPYACFPNGVKQRKQIASDEQLVNVDVEIDVDIKMAAIDLYKSQISEAWRAQVSNYHHNIRNDRPIERFWKSRTTDILIENQQFFC